MAEMRGNHGELIDRLVEVVNSSDQEDWVELGRHLAFAVGGREIDGVVLDTGKEPPPGSVGARYRDTHRLVSRDEYFRIVHRRLMDLIDSGLREDLLVRAIRDEVTHFLQQQARTEEADTRREQTRRSMEEMASNQERLSAFRKSLRYVDPQAASMTDEEVAARLQKMATSPLLGPMTKEQMQISLDRLSRWKSRSDLLSDQALKEWQERFHLRIRDEYLRGEN